MEDNIVRTTASPARRRVIIGAAVACVALPTFFVLTHGNAQTNPQPFVPPPTVQAAAPDQPKADGGTHHPIETFQVFAPRDPFQPVVVAAAGSTTGSQSSSGTQVVDATGSSSTTGSTTTSGSSDGSVSVTGHRVKLIDTFTQGGSEKARIEIDGTVYTVSPGDTFATNFKLLSIQNKCITAFFGDDQFSLCEGEEILK